MGPAGAFDIRVRMTSLEVTVSEGDGGAIGEKGGKTGTNRPVSRLVQFDIGLIQWSPLELGLYGICCAGLWLLAGCLESHLLSLLVA
jgi:hypothetical protein